VIVALWDDGEIVWAKDQRRVGGYVLGCVDQI